MKIFVIQEIESGIADCPKLFMNEKKADKYYVALVNELYDQKFKYMEKAYEYVRELESPEHDVFYWETIVDKKV